MSFFRPNKRAEVPSYVDWVREGYEADPSPANPNLPWAPNGSPAPAPSDQNWWDSMDNVRPEYSSGASLLAGLPQTPSFLRHASRGALGGAYRLISLVTIPALFATAAGLFFHYYLQWSSLFTLVAVLVTFFTVLRQASTRVSDRPELLELLKFSFQEMAVVWMMWIFGSMVYTFCRGGILAFAATFMGLLTAGLVYFLVGGRFRRYGGASKVLPYLYQIAQIVVANLLGAILGYAAGGVLWESLLYKPAPVYSNYVVGMFFAFVTFWIAVKQIYIQSGNIKGATMRSARGSDIFIN